MKNKIIKNILKVILIICIFLCISLTNGKNRKVSFVENFFLQILNMPQKGIEALQNFISQNDNYFDTEKSLKEENKKLKAENKILKEQMSDYNLIKEENKKYKNNSNNNQQYDSFKVINAEIILTPANNYDQIYVINKGSKDGVEAGQVVINNNGLVGYILECSDHSSKIISILDSTSKISARASATREEVIVNGNNLSNDSYMLFVSDIPEFIRYKSGDSFETSGMGGIYPKGITIGTVTEFIQKENYFENKAYLKPAVDFDRLESVAVIVSVNEEKNDSTQSISGDNQSDSF